MPSKHFPLGHWQVFTSWLFAGEQPQAPVRQVLGKSEVLVQQSPLLTVPPELVQPASAPPNVHWPPSQATGGGWMHEGTGQGFFCSHAVQCFVHAAARAADSVLVKATVGHIRQ